MIYSSCIELIRYPNDVNNLEIRNQEATPKINMVEPT